MAQPVSLWGATYSDVPSIVVPSGNSTAQFDDTTIDSGAAGAADITLNKKAWVNGVLLTGTNQGGGGTEAGTVTQDAQGYLVLDDDPGTHVTVDSLSVTQNGTYTASSGHAYSPVTVNVSGGSGDLKAIIERTATTPTLPSDLTKVGDYAFQACTLLALTSLPLGVTTIGASAFRSCSALALTSLPSGVTSIGNYAFYDCTNLALTSLPSGVTSIGERVFYNCTSLALTSLPSGVTSINTYAFYNCHTIALTSLPSGVTTIGTYAFYNCYALALTSLPSGITVIPSYSFYGCSSLALTSIPSMVSNIAQNAFYNCTSLALTSLPSSVTSIGQTAFYNCSSITSLTGEGTISSLSSGAFTKCGNLVQVAFPNMTISSLGIVFGNSSTASSACQKLEFADIGSTQAIAANAFKNCYALQTLVIRRSSAICTLSATTAFDNTPMSGHNSLTGTIYVPNDLISTYQTATNWSTLYNNGTVTFVAIEGSAYDLS